MFSDSSTKLQEMTLQKVLFHFVHIFVNPLNIVQGVAFGRVNSVHRSICTSASDLQTQRQPGESTTSFLFQEQIPQFFFCHLNGKASRFGTGFQVVKEGPRHFTGSFERWEWLATTVEFFVALEQPSKNWHHFPTATLADCYSAICAFFSLKIQNRELIKNIPHLVPSLWGSDTPGATGRFLFSNPIGVNVKLVATGAENTNSLVAYPRRIEMIREQTYNRQVARSASDCNGGLHWS